MYTTATRILQKNRFSWIHVVHWHGLYALFQGQLTESVLIVEFKKLQRIGNHPPIVYTKYFFHF